MISPVLLDLSFCSYQIFSQAVKLYFTSLAIPLQFHNLNSLFLQTFLELLLFLSQNIHSVAIALNIFRLPFLLYFSLL